MSPLQTLALSLLLALTWSLSGTALADSLSDEQVRRFIDVTEQINAMEEEFADLDQELERQARPNGNELPNFEHLFSSTLAKVTDHPSYGLLEDVVEDHGFDDVPEWGRVGDQVFRAWMALEMADQMNQMPADPSAMLSQLENNPNLSDAQKVQMRASVEQMMAVRKMLRAVPKGDIDTVRPHRDALRRATEMEMN